MKKGQILKYIDLAPMADVIAATEWEPIREVRPIKKN